MHLASACFSSLSSAQRTCGKKNRARECGVAVNPESAGACTRLAFRTRARMWSQSSCTRVFKFSNICQTDAEAEAVSFLHVFDLKALTGRIGSLSLNLVLIF